MKKSILSVLSLSGAAALLTGCAEHRAAYAPPPTSYSVAPQQIIVQPAPQQNYGTPVTSQPVTGEPVPVTAPPQVAPAPQQVEVAPQQPQQQIIVQQAPPPPQVEVVPVAPGPEYVWGPGYWSWNGRIYVWVGGRYYHRPYPHSVWIAPRWEHHGYGYRYHSGHWR